MTKQYRTKEWVNPSRQNIATGHKQFDLQTTSIGRGQVMGGTQFSFCIRSHNETINPVNQYVHPGYLRQYDIDQWKNEDLPCAVLNWLRANKDKAVILYQFFHHRGDKKVVHGYIITNEDGFLFSWDNGRRNSRKILDICLTYIVPLDEVAIPA